MLVVLKDSGRESRGLNTTNIVDDAISRVFGKESRGRVRGMGFGVKPSKVGAFVEKNSTVTHLESIVHNLQDEMQEMRSYFQTIKLQNDKEQVASGGIGSGVGKSKSGDSNIAAQSKLKKMTSGDISVNAKCKLLHWSVDGAVAEGRIASTDPKAKSLLDEKINEAHKLSTRIEDLESQLNKEQDDYKRITSKIKKFIRAHGRYIKAQEELKRSQTRLQKIGDQFSSDTLKLNAYEDDPSANIISDGEPNADGKISSRNNDLLNMVLFVEKRQFKYPATSKQVENGNSRKRERDFEAPFRSEKLQRSERPAPMSETTIKRIETMKAILKRNTTQLEDYNHKQGRNTSSIGSLDKGKGSEVRHSLPLTGMAAHAVDELLEANEFDEKHEAAETIAVNETDDADRSTKSTYIPPPPHQATQNAYKQYEGDDEEIDVEKVDSEMLDIDINSEVDIEQV